MSLGARILVICLIAGSALGQTQKPSPQPSPSPSRSPNVVEAPKTSSKVPPSKVEQVPADSTKTTPAPTSKGSLEILSDTMGVDFKPYLRAMKSQIQQHWLPLIPQSAMAPEMKSGTVVVRFAILKDGKMTDLKLEEKSGDVALDRAAYGAIVYSSPLPPLPTQFKADSLDVRARFHYNPDAQAGRDAEKKSESPQKPKPDTAKDPAHP